MSRRVRLFALLLAAMVIVVVLAIDWTAGFIAYRSGNYHWRPGGTYRGSEVRIASDQYHHGLRALSRMPDEWGPLRYELVTNSLGLKDATQRDIALRHDGLRILFIGDSFTEGLGFAFEKTWVGRIASELEPEGVDVLNAGLTSYCPKLEYYRVRDLIERVGLEIDELVVFVDNSDAPDELMYNDFVPVDPDPHDTWSDRYVIDRAKPKLHEYSLIFRTVRRWIHRDPWRQIRFARRDGSEEFLFINVRAGWTRWPSEQERWADKGLQSAAFYMDRLADLCGEHGVVLSIGVYPWPLDVRYAALDSPHRTFWLEFAAQRGLRITDLYPAFIPDDEDARRRILDTDFIAGDVHHTEAGHRRMATGWLENNEP